MRIPYVIDNQTTLLVDVLNRLFQEHKGRSLDVASAYFTVGGFSLIHEGLQGLGSFRLLLGQEPFSGDQLGMRPDPMQVRGLLRQDLETLPFDEKTLGIVEELIAYLRRTSVLVRVHEKGFLHAKCARRERGPGSRRRPEESVASDGHTDQQLKREDLQLVCFDFVSGG